MSEQQPKGPEAPLKNIELTEQSKQNLERLQDIGRQAEGQHSHEKIADLRQEIEEVSTSAKEVSVGESESAAQASPLGMHRELKADAYKRTIQRIQSQLSAPEKAFSKFTHQPVVDRISDMTGKSIVRSSGVIGGGLATLVGSAYLLYVAKHVGFTYNYFVFGLLFAAGFVAGLIVEVLIKLFKRR